MHTATGIADALREPPLERAMRVLIGELDRPFAGRMRRRERLEALADRFGIRGAEQLLLLEHARVSDRRAGVVRDEPLVELVILAGREAQDALVERQALVPEARHALARLFLGPQRLRVVDDERARSFVREYFEQQAVGLRVRDDVYPRHTARQRALDRGRLRQHAARDFAF